MRKWEIFACFIYIREQKSGLTPAKKRHSSRYLRGWGILLSYDKIVNGKQVIRNDIIPIIRITVRENEEMVLKGTVKLSNMIPVPENAIFDYDIDGEENEQYKALVRKEYEVLKQKEKKLLKNAKCLYKQKTKEDILYVGENTNKKPGYLSATIDFKYAEQVYI